MDQNRNTMPLRARAALSLLESSRDGASAGAHVDGTRHTTPADEYVGLGGLRLLRCQVELGRYSAELGERPSFHLPHRVAAVDFHCGFGNAYVPGNLLAKASPCNLNHNLSLP